MSPMAWFGLGLLSGMTAVGVAWWLDTVTEGFSVDDVDIDEHEQGPGL